MAKTNEIKSTITGGGTENRVTALRSLLEGMEVSEIGEVLAGLSLYRLLLVVQKAHGVMYDLLKTHVEN